MIYFDRIFKKYEQGNVVLKNLNLSISEGEFVSIVGPSGSGKTTILRLALGDEKPTSGDIFFRSLNINKLRDADIPNYRKQIGVVFQDLKLLDDKTVAENLGLMLELMDTREGDIRQAVHDALEIVGLPNYENRFPTQLSGGEKQRVAFARAIINEPNILMADEPTAWLDEKNANNIMDVLDKIHSAGTTIIMTTHQKDLVKGRGKGHKVLHLENGEIINGNEKGENLVQ